jgi:CRP-like cAMP-binding protein
VTFLPGDTVIGQHERGDALYVITRGRVSVKRKEIGGSEIKLAELCDGEFFGETALLGDQVRTATVKATATTTLLRLSRRDVLALAKENSEVERRLEDAKSARGASRGS